MMVITWCRDCRMRADRCGCTDAFDEATEDAAATYDRLCAAEDAYWEARIDARRNGDDDRWDRE